MIKITAGLILLAASAACAGPPERAGPVAEAASAVEADAAPTTLSELLPRIEAAYRKGDYARGLSLVRKALELKQADVSSLDRIGSVYYVLGRYGEALTIWRRALPLEQDLQKRRELESSIAVARRTLGIADDEAPAPAPAPAKKTPRRPPPREEVLKLYKLGVKHYAQGEYLQAIGTFQRVLELDPGNADARKALERLRLEPGAETAPAP